jgi:hypothetical protein
MFDWTFFSFASLLGMAIAFSYVLVFGNITNSFNFDGIVYSYVDSPYWLGTSKNNIYSLIVFQLFAALGYTLWLFWACTETNYGTSILRFKWVRSLLIVLFLGSSVAWPYSAYYYMLSPSLSRSLLTCSCLWISSIAVTLLVAGTFEADPPFYALVGILLLANVVVLADGVGWSARCIQDALYR